MTEPPAGWGVLELAEQRARDALASWDLPRPATATAGGRALYLHRATVLAGATRKLLAELDAERRLRSVR